MVLGGHELPAQYLANWILGKPNPTDTLYGKLAAHDTTIELDNVVRYLTALEVPEELKGWQSI